MKELIKQNTFSRYSSTWFFWIYTLALLGSGLGYFFIQYSQSGEILDSWFIGLLFGASLILLFGFRWIQSTFRSEIGDFLHNLSPNTSQEDAFWWRMRRVFRNPWASFVGLLYGIGVGSAVFIYGIWEEYMVLRFLLILFLFIVNYLTGVALFNLTNLFRFLYKSSKLLEVDIFNAQSLSMFISLISKRACTIAAFYVSFSIGSIYFSLIPLDGLTVGYSIFSASIIVAAYILPLIPISNQTLNKKRKIINRLSSDLQDEFDRLLSSNSHLIDSELKKFRAIVELRSQVQSVGAIPIGFKAIWNSLYIVGITFLPVILQVFLEKLVTF